MTAAEAIIGLAIAVGGFALGKAALDHVAEERGEVDTDLTEFEEQHYYAAGFGTKKGGARVQDDVVAFIAAVAGIYVIATTAPQALKELTGAFK